MARDEKPDANVITVDGRKFLQFVRYIDRPVEKIWTALTVPERVEDWLGKAEIEPKVGGSYNIVFGDDGSTAIGVILAFDPPKRLAFTWGGQPDPEQPGVVFGLEPEGSGCRLTLTTTFPEDHGGDVAEAVATWHEFLLAIPYAVDGIRLDWDEPRKARRQSLIPPYREMLAAADISSAPE